MLTIIATKIVCLLLITGSVYLLQFPYYLEIAMVGLLVKEFKETKKKSIKVLTVILSIQITLIIIGLLVLPEVYLILISIQNLLR